MFLLYLLLVANLFAQNRGRIYPVDPTCIVNSRQLSATIWFNNWKTIYNQISKQKSVSDNLNIVKKKGKKVCHGHWVIGSG